MTKCTHCKQRNVQALGRYTHVSITSKSNGRHLKCPQHSDTCVQHCHPITHPATTAPSHLDPCGVQEQSLNGVSGHSGHQLQHALHCCIMQLPTCQTVGMTRRVNPLISGLSPIVHQQHTTTQLTATRSQCLLDQVQIQCHGLLACIHNYTQVQMHKHTYMHTHTHAHSHTHMVHPLHKHYRVFTCNDKQTCGSVTFFACTQCLQVLPEWKQECQCELLLLVDAATSVETGLTKVEAYTKG